jgi:MFS family permease
MEYFAGHAHLYHQHLCARLRCVFLASFSANKLWWLYLSYGFIGGLGLGLGYIVPVAVLVKWFPDKRGLITGIAVGGFGAGALITAPVATRLIHVIAGVMAVSILLPIIVHPPRREGAGEKPGTIGLTPHPAPPRD